MKKHLDQDLSLEQLISCSKQLEPNACIRIFYDPLVRFFYISHADTLSFWIPNSASFLFQCEAGNLCNAVEIFISQAVNKLKKEAQA